MTEPHCRTCTCGWRAPVQGYYPGERHQRKPGEPGYGDGSISWEEYLLAHAAYARTSWQSAEQLAQRGGFGWFELVEYLGREPTTWRPGRIKWEAPRESKAPCPSCKGKSPNGCNLCNSGGLG